MTIYLDVLLLSNLWVDYALLRTSAALTHVPFRRGRGLLAALLGALSALILLLPPLPLPLCLILRAAIAAAVCAAAFGIRELWRNTAVFCGVSVIFCGAVSLLAMLRTPVGWYARNTFLYADISLLTLLAGTAAAALTVTLRARFSTHLPHRKYRLHLRIGTQDFMLPALADTGSSLCDCFSGRPVIVCGKDTLRAWISQYPDAEQAAASVRGFRMIPVKTVAGTKLLPAFSPDYAALRAADDSHERPVDILIALSSEHGTPAIIPAMIL